MIVLPPSVAPASGDDAPESAPGDAGRELVPHAAKTRSTRGTPGGAKRREVSIDSIVRRLRDRVLAREVSKLTSVAALARKTFHELTPLELHRILQLRSAVFVVEQ